MDQLRADILTDLLLGYHAFDSAIHAATTATTGTTNGDRRRHVTAPMCGTGR